MLTGTQISCLPDNILLEIFTHLKVKELCIVCRVCRSWRRIANDNAMWRHVDMTTYKLNLHKMWKVIRAHFSEVLLSLHLKGYHQAGSANLMKNSLSEAMMKDLQERCPNINNLEIINNHFTQVKLDQFPQKLESLKLTSCFIPANWFVSAGTKGLLPGLKVLDLSDSVKTSDADIKQICSWKDLQVLRLNGCYRVTSTGLETIGQTLVNLRELQAREVKCSDVALHHIGRNLKQLEKLVLSGRQNQRSNISNTAVINSVSTLSKLKHIDFSHSDLDDRALMCLNVLKYLVNINMSYTKVTKKGVENFKTMYTGTRDVCVITDHIDQQKDTQQSNDTHSSADNQSQATLEY